MTSEPIFLDTETYSATPINNGTYRYAEDSEIIVWQWAVGDGPVQIRDGDEDVSDLMDLLLSAGEQQIVIHNSMFDRNVIAEYGVTIPVNHIFDTMVCAMAHSLPGALGALCEILRVPTDKAKDKAGKALIQLFCKPRPKTSKLRRATKLTHPEEWKRFREYGGLDIEAMRAVYKKLPRWNYRGAEYDLWCLDQKINDRGVFVDQELAHAATRAIERAQLIHGADVERLTEGEVHTAGQRDKLLAFALEAHGVLLPDLKISTLETRINDADLPVELRELLAVRLQSSKTSGSKYKRVINGVSRDGRLRGLLAFDGALRTGRWSGRLFQPQNLPRPSISNLQIERGIEALKADAEDLI